MDEDVIRLNLELHHFQAFVSVISDDDGEPHIGLKGHFSNAACAALTVLHYGGYGYIWNSRKKQKIEGKDRLDRIIYEARYN